VGKAQNQSADGTGSAKKRTMPGEAPRSYLDIGHNAGSYVWLIDEGILVRFGSGTHEEIWGVQKSFTCWRGRFDPETSQASVAAPENWPGGPPRRAIRKVAEAFRSSAIWFFPWPPGSPPRLVTPKGTRRTRREG